MGRFFVPRIGILAVLGLAILLIGVIVLRSPDTHANLWNRMEAGYSRTAVGVVATEGQTSVAETRGGPVSGALSFQAPIWLEVPQGGASGRITDPGQRLYIASGCAKCHGMDGQGGVVGPSLVGMDPQIITAMARIGPGGMPAFLPRMLSDSELSEIGAYLNSLGPATPPAATPAASAPVPTPAPTAAPTPTSGAAAAPPTPVASTPAPTPEAAAATSDPVRGSELYAGKCAACHGGDATGKYGPSLTGLDPDDMEQAVRQGKGGMPAFGTNTISEQDLEDILAYIAALASTGGGRQ